LNSKKAKIKEIEYHLRQYKTYQITIKNIEQQLEWILPSMTASYDAQEGSCGTFNITSKVETAVLDRLESKQALDLLEEKSRYEVILSSIDRAMSLLSEKEIKFIQSRYFERKSIAEVAEEMTYSEKHMQNIKKNIMDSLLISLSGVLKI